jgi:hypothetical protein
MPLIQPVERPNIANLILQGLGAARQFEGLRQDFQEGTRKKQLADIVSRLGSDPTALQQLSVLDPARAASYQKSQAAMQERFEREKANTAAQIENLPLNDQLRALDERIAMVTKRGGDPSNTQRLRDMLASGDPQQIARGQFFIGEARKLGEKQGYLKPQAEAKQPTPLALERKLRLAGIDPQSQEGQRIIKADLIGQQISFESTPEGGTEIRIGKGAAEDRKGLERSTKGQLEKNIVEKTLRLDRLAEIGRLAKPEFFQYGPQFADWISVKAEKAGIEPSALQKQAIDERTRFMQQLGREASQYRREITGAAAAVKELDRLMSEIINKNLSWTQFQSAWKGYVSENARALRIYKQFLKEGMQGNPKNPNSPIARALDAAFMGGVDYQNPQERLKELRQQGLSKEQIFNQMDMEGFTRPQK